MEIFEYKLDEWSGPLDVILTLVKANKMDIHNIQISIICDQYLEYINQIEANKMDIASEFIVMATELMVIKSRMLLPHEENTDKDPRKVLENALEIYAQAKEGSLLLLPLWKKYIGRMEKDTDEITVDKTYVADQDIMDLCLAVRAMIDRNAGKKDAPPPAPPILKRPHIDVELKAIGILHYLEDHPSSSMKELLEEAVSVVDLIAIFLGILDLIKKQKILLDKGKDNFEIVHGMSTCFVLNPNPPSPEELNESHRTWDDKEPIPLSSKAEMHREQRRVIREAKEAEKKRLRAEAREQARLAKLAGQQAVFVPENDDDIARESQIAEMLDANLSEREEDMMDDLGIDMQKVVEAMAEKAKDLPDDNK